MDCAGIGKISEHVRWIILKFGTNICDSPTKCLDKFPLVPPWVSSCGPEWNISTSFGPIVLTFGSRRWSSLVQTKISDPTLYAPQFLKNISWSSSGATMRLTLVVLNEMSRPLGYWSTWNLKQRLMIFRQCLWTTFLQCCCNANTYGPEQNTVTFIGQIVLKVGRNVQQQSILTILLCSYKG